MLYKIDYGNLSQVLNGNVKFGAPKYKKNFEV